MVLLRGHMEKVTWQAGSRKDVQSISYILKYNQLTYITVIS